MRPRPPRSTAPLSFAFACALACSSACHAPRTSESAGARAGEPLVSLELGFDRSRPGDPPSGFSAVAGTWLVRASSAQRGNVVAQSGESSETNGAPPANLLLLDNVKAQEVDVAVKLRAVAGELDRGGGLAWRVRDPRNHYLARWNPLDGTVRLYKVIDGERKQLASDRVRAPEPARSNGGWHELRITMKGEQIRCTFDGRPSASARDKGFTEAGRVGLWTHADAETEFDDLRVLASR